MINRRVLISAVLLLAACGTRQVPLARTEVRADSLRYVIGKPAPFTGIVLVPRDSASGISVTMPFANGLRDGKGEGRHRNGTRAFEETWKAGKREGTRQEWDSAGRLTRTEQFAAGLLEGTMQDFNSEGKVVVERPMHADRQHGTVKTWYAEGPLRSEAGYENGLLQGSMKIWYPNGQLKYEGVFAAGKPNGQVSEFYDSGKPKARTSWSAGVADGPYTRWYDNGQRQVEGVYRNSEQISAKYWDPNGKLIPKPTSPSAPAMPHPPMDQPGS